MDLAIGNKQYCIMSFRERKNNFGIRIVLFLFSGISMPVEVRGGLENKISRMESELAFFFYQKNLCQGGTWGEYI